jgi:hypothetical protein
MLPTLSRVNGVPVSVAEEVFAREALRDHAPVELRLSYISTIASAWGALGVAGFVVVVTVGIVAGVAFGDAVQRVVVVILGCVTIACVVPPIASPWFRSRARAASREAARPDANPDRLRRLASAARPGGGLLVVQLAAAVLALPLFLTATQ